MNRNRRFEMWLDPSGRIVHRRFHFGHWQWPIHRSPAQFRIRHPLVWEAI